MNDPDTHAKLEAPMRCPNCGRVVVPVDNVTAVVLRLCRDARPERGRGIVGWEAGAGGHIVERIYRVWSGGGVDGQ